MRKTHLALFGAVALSLVAISAPAAQQAENRNDNRRKPPKQTHDKGIDDPDPAFVPVAPIGERRAGNAVIVSRNDGTVVALLDESFQDALVARKNPDGSTSFTCLHGLPAGASHAQLPAAPVSTAPVSTTPALEEK